MKKQKIKMVEIRDRETFIPSLIILMMPENEEEMYLMKQAGYGFTNPCIMLIPIQSPWYSARSSDEYVMKNGRTLSVAHKYIENNFHDLKNYQVIDVEFILGEVEQPCKSCLQEEIEERDRILLEQCESEDNDNEV